MTMCQTGRQFTRSAAGSHAVCYQCLSALPMDPPENSVSPYGSGTHWIYLPTWRKVMRYSHQALRKVFLLVLLVEVTCPDWRNQRDSPLGCLSMNLRFGYRSNYLTQALRMDFTLRLRFSLRMHHFHQRSRHYSTDSTRHHFRCKHLFYLHQYFNLFAAGVIRPMVTPKRCRSRSTQKDRTKYRFAKPLHPA